MILPAALKQVTQSIRSFLSSKSPESVAATEDEPPAKRKRGRKTSDEKAIHDEMVRRHAIDWVKDPLERSLWAFCSDNEITHLRTAFQRLFDKEKAVRVIADKKDARKDPALVAVAVEAIQRRFERSTSQNIQQQVDTSRLDTNSILNFERLKEIVESLDFESPTRMSRDGTKEIKLHERKTADEILKYSIFDLANRVVDYSNLPPNMRKSVMSYCAKVLFYDFGYKSVKGLSTSNIADWTKRLENVYKNGSVSVVHSCRSLPKT